MAPSSTDLVAQLSLTDRDRDRLARAFYSAKASEYRATLHELSSKFGHPRSRVVLSASIRDALREEARQHAAQVVDTMNGYLRGEAGRTEHLPPELRARRLQAYMRARGQARGDLIARTEVATARLDATLGFYRENGIEPEVEFVGPKPQCPTCVELMATNPHTMEKALAVGLPHINCRHSWRAKGVRRSELQGGIRPGQISAGRGDTAGVIHSDPLVSRAGSSEAAAALLRTLSQQRRHRHHPPRNPEFEGKHPRGEGGRFGPKGDGAERRKPKPIKVGFNDDFSNLSAAGFGAAADADFARFPINYPFDANADAAYAEALAHGVTPIIGVGGWSSGPKTVEAYAAAMAEAARRYPQATLQLWNEPNLSAGRYGIYPAYGVEPDQLVAMCIAAAKAIRAVNPNARILGPPIAPVGDWEGYFKSVYGRFPPELGIGVSLNLYPSGATGKARLAELRRIYKMAARYGPVTVTELDIAAPWVEPLPNQARWTRRAIELLSRLGARGVILNSIAAHAEEMGAIAHAAHPHRHRRREAMTTRPYYGDDPDERDRAGRFKDGLGVKAVNSGADMEAKAKPAGRWHVVKGGGSKETPFSTQWYVVDENRRAFPPGTPRYLRRGDDLKRDAQRYADDKNQAELAPTTETVGELTDKDQRVLRAIDTYGYQRVGDDVPEEQVQRLEAHGEVRRETRTTILPDHRRLEYEVIVRVQG